MIHTQEPWEVQNGSTGPYIIAKDGDNHVAVAQFFSRGIAGCETKGNVRLGKAAPKMYEALREANEYIAELKKAIKDTCEDEGLPFYESTELDKVIVGINEALAEVEGKEDKA